MRDRPITTVMTTNVVTVERDRSLSDVYHALEQAGFHHMPVVEGDTPVGMISATDVLKLVYDVEGSDDSVLTNMLDHQFNIDDAMTTELVTLPDTASVHDAAEVLATGALHSVVVVDADGSMAGIVTTTDLVRCLRDL